MKRVTHVLIAILLVSAALSAGAQEGSEPAGVLFAGAGVQYHLGGPAEGAIADAGLLGDLRVELGVGMLARGNGLPAPFVYGGDFRLIGSFAQVQTDDGVAETAGIAPFAMPLRGAFGVKFEDLHAAAVAGVGLYGTAVTAGGDAVRLSVGYETGLKAVMSWGLYGEVTFLAPEGIFLIQDSQFFGEQAPGLLLAIGWNFLSASPQEVQEIQAAAQ
ncbi:MAG: hypothetical protein GVY29_07635 [Spirochaetes bacterium]|jgi:hypothetical protein|nr:hypothetical protein [Spirochaetota bacterium]